MIRAPRLLSLAAILLAATSVPALGQTATAALTGVVQDSTGTGLASVEILVANVATGFAYGSITSESGRYWLAGLPPGDYDITASRLGMETTQYEGVALPIGKTLTLDFQVAISALEIAGIRVAAPRRLLASTQADIAFSIDREVIRDIPDASRQFINLAELVPGATTASLEGRTGGSGGIGGPGVSVGALNGQSLGVVIDGSDFTEALFGELAGSIPLLAVQEFEVIQTQYSAQLGRAASGTINAVTRRGGNETVLEAFGLYRHRSLNALGEFETVKPDFNQRHWGVAYGGPIVRDRTHFFAAFERRVQNDFVEVNTNGVFPDLEGSVPTPLTDNLIFARIDHRVNDRHELTLRLSGQTGEKVSLINPLGGAAAADFASQTHQDMFSTLLTHRWSLGGGVLNQLQLHALNQKSSQEGLTTEGATLLYPSVITGPTVGTSPSQDNTRIELNDDLSWVMTGSSGTHRLQLGTQLSWQRSEAEVASFVENATCLFLDDADPAPIFCRVSLGEDPTVGLKSHQNLQIGLYVQDNWTPTPSLTLNLGLRYDIETNGTNQDGVSAYADLVPVFLQEPRSVDKNNIAPRIGLAWDPAADGRTVVRAGFGIFYDALPSWALVGLEQSSGLLTTDVFFPTTLDADSLRLGIDPATIPPLVWPVGEIRTPMTRQFSLGVQRALPWDVMIRVDGLYSQGRNLLIERNLQRIDPVDGPRYPGIGGVYQILGEGQANARMLMFDVRKTFSRGWANLAYTLADRKNTNDVWQEFVTQTDPNNEDFSSLLGPAAWDERHRLVGSGSVAILDDLSVSGKAIYSSAKPYTALTGTDDNLDGEPQGPNDIPAGEGRNARRGPDYFRADLSIAWNPVLVGGRNVGLMLNIYNVFNTTNLDAGSIQGIVTAPSFGEPVAAFPKRQVELGMQIR